jgi:hypothetical protein
MKVWLRFLLLGVLSLVLFMAATLPAEWAGKQLEDRVSGLAFYGAEGTFWRGEASAIRYNSQLIRDVKWRVSPFSLLIGRLKLSFHGELRDGRVGGLFIRPLLGSDQPITLRNFYLKQPATHLAALFIPADFPTEARGLIDLNFNEFQIQANGTLSKADGALFWNEAAIEQNRELISLGDFSMQFITKKNEVHLLLRDGGGALKTELDAKQVVSTGDFSITGTLGYREGANRLIVMLLSAQFNLRGEKEKQIHLEGNIKNPSVLLEQMGE